ncbi:hypothetical protein [Thermococcus piezophilus]|uniref:hypothetical protein n=1 Tax=Thermococcus piezophilus TaxID=1712654 RepID=UPI000B197E4A|nr:hypothetical protein [Thermococcus piezophilus]
MEKLLTSGCYSRVRHSIYSIWGFFIVPGFSLMLAEPPPLQFIYHIWLAVVRLICEEEKEIEERFGNEWREYTSRTPRFIPRI